VSKGIYRSVNVEGVVSAALVALLTTTTAIVGIDVAKFDLVAAFALDTGQVVQIVRFHQLQQTPLFLALIAALQQAGRTIQIAMEPTGTYGEALRERLQAAGVAVFMVPAKHVHDARELFDNVPSKHDPKDAVLIAKLRAQGHGTLWKPVDPFRRDLRALVEARDIHHEPLMQGYSRLEALLARHWPELSSLVNIYETASVWKLLREMPDPHQIAAQHTEAAELLGKQSRSAFDNAAIEAIIHCARDTMGVAPTRLERTQLQRVVSEMLRHRSEIRAIDREVRDLLATRPEFGAMSRWVGLVTTAVLVGCVGDPIDFHHAGAYEKACGLNLKEQSSGTATRRGLHITHRGPARARKYLYLFALRWKARDPAARAWAERRQSWPREGGKISAVVALMRKATSALWHLRRGQDYQASKLFDLRRLELALPAPDMLISEADASEEEAPHATTDAAATPRAGSLPDVVADEPERAAATSASDAPKVTTTASDAPKVTTTASDAPKVTTTASDTPKVTRSSKRGAAARRSASDAPKVTSSAKRGPTARSAREDHDGAASVSEAPRACAPDATQGAASSARATASPTATAPSHGGKPPRTLSSTLERVNALVRTSSR
jgi:transposase